MWTKSADGKGLSGVRIPHTVYYNRGQAAAWWFTSKDGAILRRSKENLTSVHIREGMAKARRPAGAAGDVVCTLRACERGAAGGAGVLQEYFLTEQAVARVVKMCPHGLLQGYLPPREEGGGRPRDSVLTCYWNRAGRTARLHRRRCAAPVGSVHAAWRDRYAACDVPPAPAASRTLVARATDVCRTIAAHVARTTHRLCHYMELELKVGARGELWVCGCASWGVSPPPGAAQESVQSKKWAAHAGGRGGRHSVASSSSELPPALERAQTLPFSHAATVATLEARRRGEQAKTPLPPPRQEPQSAEAFSFRPRRLRVAVAAAAAAAAAEEAEGAAAAADLVSPPPSPEHIVLQDVDVVESSGDDASAGATPSHGVARSLAARPGIPRLDLTPFRDALS